MQVFFSNNNMQKLL